MARTRWRRTCEPRPLVQDGQIRPAPPVGARKPGARPTNRFAGQPERRQPTRRSGRDPGPPTLRPRQVTVGEAAPEARSTLSLPTRSGRQFDRLPSSLTTLLRRPLCVVDRSPPGKRHGVYGLAAHDVPRSIRVFISDVDHIPGAASALGSMWCEPDIWLPAAGQMS